MKSSLVLTFSGPDRPGIVERLAQVIRTYGGNWERSRMARVGGRFAGLVQVTIEGAKATELARELEGISGLRVAVDAADAVEATQAVDRTLLLELTGQDRKGIVHEVTSVLARYGVNIEDLTTESFSAPMSGDALFSARAVLRGPAGLDVNQLRSSVAALSQELMIDISFSEPQDVPSGRPKAS